MKHSTIWTCLVDSDGNLSEWDGSSGVAYCRTFTPLIDYARALIYSKKHRLSFYYFHENRCLHIHLTRHKDSFVIMEMADADVPYGLSRRELELLVLISCGLTNAEIAEQLSISERTVAKHVENIFQKTEIDNRAMLAVFAVTENLCCLPTPGNLEKSILAIFEVERWAKRLQQEAVNSQQKNAKKSPLFTLNIPSSYQRKFSYSSPIKIGVPYVQQGIGQIDTQELLNGSRLAVETINQQGGIHGRMLELEPVGFCVNDQQSILSAYQTLFDKEVDAISTSYACYSPDIHELVASKGIPYLHLATHSESNKRSQNLSIDTVDNIFQVCASDVNYGSGVVRFLHFYQQYYPDFIKNRRLLVIRVKWQPIDIGIEQLIYTLKAENWQVEVLELEQGEGIFEYAMKTVHQMLPTLIVLASYFTEDILQFYATFMQQPTNSILYSIYAPSALLPEQHLCEGVLWASTTGRSENYLGKQFAQQYTTLFGHIPSYSQASVAYDQVQILANVWRQSVSPRGFKEITQGIKALPYHGINGTYYFGTKSQIGLTYPDDTTDLSISQPHLIYQIQQGKSSVIAPALFAEKSFVLPHWFNLHL